MTEPYIGPPATHLVFENDDAKVWLMEVEGGDAFWFHHHHYDYVLYYLTDVLATAPHATDDHAATWTDRYDHTRRNDDAKTPARDGIMTFAHSLFYIPGTGFLSPGFQVLGTSGMLAPLVEIKRPRRRDQEAVGFARTDALVARAPVEGSAHLLENDRVRVYETRLAPGACDPRRAHDDAAVFVIEGSTLEVDDQILSLETRSGTWRPAARARQLRNVGTTAYRELSVELK